MNTSIKKIKMEWVNVRLFWKIPVKLCAWLKFNSFLWFLAFWLWSLLYNWNYIPFIQRIHWGYHWSRMTIMMTISLVKTKMMMMMISLVKTMMVLTLKATCRRWESAHGSCLHVFLSKLQAVAGLLAARRVGCHSPLHELGIVIMVLSQPVKLNIIKS